MCSAGLVLTYNCGYYITSPLVLTYNCGCYITSPLVLHHPPEPVTNELLLVIKATPVTSCPVHDLHGQWSEISVRY